MAFLAAVVLVPLGREYADLRRSYALSRLGALATTFLVYSFATRAIVANAAAAGTAPSRSTRG